MSKIKEQKKNSRNKVKRKQKNFPDECVFFLGGIVFRGKKKEKYMEETNGFYMSHAIMPYKPEKLKRKFEK